MTRRNLQRSRLERTSMLCSAPALNDDQTQVLVGVLRRALERKRRKAGNN